MAVMTLRVTCKTIKICDFKVGCMSQHLTLHSKHTGTNSRALTESVNPHEFTLQPTVDYYVITGLDCLNVSSLKVHNTHQRGQFSNVVGPYSGVIPHIHNSFQKRQLLYGSKET